MTVKFNYIDTKVWAGRIIYRVIVPQVLVYPIFLESR